MNELLGDILSHTMAGTTGNNHRKNHPGVLHSLSYTESILLYIISIPVFSSDSAVREIRTDKSLPAHGSCEKKNPLIAVSSWLPG